jgi:hypothetical protein
MAYGTGGTGPLTGAGTGAAVGTTGTGAAVGTLAVTGIHLMFFAVLSVSLLVVGFVLVRIAAHRTHATAGAGRRPPTNRD